jgi:phosphoglycerate dehydrogenase-like enzyme
MGQDLSLADCPLRIVVLGKRDDPWLTELAGLPASGRIIAWGENLAALTDSNGRLFSEGNVLFCASGGAKELGPVISAMPFLEWLHVLFAGIDHIICKELKNSPELVVTNAKTVFSSSLAEYVMMACGYFNKQVPRLLRNKENKEYERYTMGELKGRTMGIVGYGDIGQTTARLAKAYGMRVLGLRRHPELSADDPLLDQVVGSGEEELLMLMRESDYLLVCAPLTPETNKMIGEKQLINARKGQVLINVGRGALLDEEALAAALQVGFSSVLDHRALMPLSSAWILTLPPPHTHSPSTHNSTDSSQAPRSTSSQSSRFQRTRRYGPCPTCSFLLTMQT